MSSAWSTAAAAAAGDDGDRAPSQAGVIGGSNPSKYNPKDPIILFIIQAGLIIVLCHLLHWPLSKIRQPRVIAEVVGGILLGPSVMGRIPGFRAAIFPDESIPNLTLVANLGLVLYLFLIGLETDVRFLVSNWRIASAVAFAGLALPFGLGCALAWGLYNEFRTEPGIVHIEFSTYMLFIGVAIAITAFPVLCRILTELNLLGTYAGVVTLSAGVANDVIGWILLALCVALANAGSGIDALWILLCCLGYLLLLLFAVKPGLHWLLRRTGNLEHGPSQRIISVILLVALASAFFTGIIGVHPIFGGFMVGLIVPREKSFTIKVTEKLEDLIGAIFLPLYFTLSGLNTDLGLLDSGITWAYVVAVTLTAFFSKIIGATLAARLTGMVWRESFTVGSLMSCKGLVELVVLNIGLQAQILSVRTFTIFVVMALLTTFATTPLVTYLYPPWYQKKLGAWKRGEIDWDGNVLDNTDAAAGRSLPGGRRIQQLLVYLRLDNMPGLLGLVSLFGKDEAVSDSSEGNDKEQSTMVSKLPTRAVRAHGVRLLQLGDRDSSVMTVSEVEEYTKNDPVVNTWRTVCQILKLAVSGEVVTLPEARFSEALLARAADMSPGLVLLPWSGTGTMDDSQTAHSDDRITSSFTSFTRSMLSSRGYDMGVLFPQGSSAQAAAAQAASERMALQRAYSFSEVRRDMQPLPVRSQARRIIVPFLGGDDDRFALGLALQLCERPEVTAAVLHIPAGERAAGAGPEEEEEDRAFLDEVAGGLAAAVAARVEFQYAPSSEAAEELAAAAEAAVREDAGDVGWDNLVVVGRGGGRRLGRGKTAVRVSDEMVECLGDAAAVLIGTGIKADVLVVQARAARA